MTGISAENCHAVLASLPEMPGVYRYFDRAGACLYVGKARNLKRRVSSYFRKGGLSPRIALMASMIARLETTVVRTEAEAFLLESNLIKELKPKYNITFRDDKTYPYLRITAGDFPRICCYRGPVDRTEAFFGPFPSAASVHESISVLQKVFRIRTCEESSFRNRSRPCLMGQIGRCSSPCVGAVSKDEYAAEVENARRFLRGQSGRVLDELRARMLAASAVMRYEEAAVLRDRIAALNDVLRGQAIEVAGSDIDADIIAVAVDGAGACVNLAMVRGGRHLGDRVFFPDIEARTAGGLAPAEVFEAFVSHHYRSGNVPGLVISRAAEDPAAARETLCGLAGRSVSLVCEPQQVRRKWLEMAEQGAAMALARRAAGEAGDRHRLEALGEVLGLQVPDEGLHIECFDISHSSGEAAQASCVVFEGSGMNSRKYRRFNISDVTPGDDYAAMRQVLGRRYSPAARGEAPLPDLVLVDGGRGQVHVASDVFSGLGLPVSVIVGVAKGEGRKTGLETLVFADGREPLVLGPGSPALMLVAMIRDEAHRFAITGMRAKRSRARRRSGLEDIEGIGPRRRQQLLTRFGGIRGVSNASIEDIAKIDGFSETLAGKVYMHFHGGGSDGHSS